MKTLWRWFIALFKRTPDPASPEQRRVADVAAADARRVGTVHSRQGPF